MFFVLAAVSLPVPPLKADAPTLPNRFFLSSLDLAGFGIPALASLRASQVCQTLLISSYISRCCPTGAASAGVDDAARHLPGRGAALPAWGPARTN